MKMPIPIRGPFSLPFKVFGITQSKMNPNICTICERAFQRVKSSRHISQNATILFVDIRGFTQVSEQIGAVALSEIVSDFQDQCAHSIWSVDGIVNKQMGDGLMAIFNFPIKAEDHAKRAVEAAIGIQQRCKQNLPIIAERLNLAGDSLGVGVGVHTGDVEIGEFSSGRTEFTAIGGVVNMAARLEAAASAGEIVVSPETAALAGGLPKGVRRRLTLKGISTPIDAVVLSA